MWTSYVLCVWYNVLMIKTKDRSMDSMQLDSVKSWKLKNEITQDWALVRFIGTDKTEWYVISSLKRSGIPDPIEEMRKLYGTEK